MLHTSSVEKLFIDGTYHAGAGSRYNPKGEQENRMRGDDKKSEGMFSYISAESEVPKDHPLRRKECTAADGTVGIPYTV